MFKDVKYAPQMSQHKLAKSNMTTITDANLGKAMGDLNRFFSHNNICKLTGFRFEVVGQKVHVMPDGFKYTTDIEGDRQVPIYHPIPKGRCRIHSLWKDYLKDKPTYKDPNEVPRFAISSIYEPHCLPVGIGDRYKIFGDRLIIYHAYDKYIHKNPWMRYSEFIRMSEVDKEQYLQMQINGLHSLMYDEMYYVQESLSGRISSNYDKEDLEGVIKELHEQVSQFVEEEIRNCDGTDSWKELLLKGEDLDDIESHSITFRFNPHRFLQHGLEGKDPFYEYIKYDPEDPDWSCNSLIYSVVGAYQRWIDTQNAEYAESHKDDPIPDDYDPWDW